MAITLSVYKMSSPSNPDRVFLKAVMSGNYTQVTGDTLNLTPSTWKDPLSLGVVGPETVPTVTPSPFNENIGGYYAQVVRGTTLANFGLRFFQPGGAEVAAGAYPAAISGGEVFLEVPFQTGV